MSAIIGSIASSGSKAPTPATNTINIIFQQSYAIIGGVGATNRINIENQNLYVVIEA